MPAAQRELRLRYALQLGFNEVVEWFEDAGYEPRLQSPATYRRMLGSGLVGIGVNGRRDVARVGAVTGQGASCAS